MIEITEKLTRVGELNDPQFVSYVRKQQETTPDLATNTHWLTAIRQEIDMRLLLAYTKLSG